MKKKSNYFVAIVAFLVGWIILITQSNFLSNQILFQPPPVTYQDNASIIKLTTANGKKISAIYLPAKGSHFVILYSHGNTVDLGRVYPILKAFRDHGYSIFAYDYQGYGTSEGRSSEKNTYMDINAAYGYLTSQLRIPPSRIVAMGVSLGAGVTIELAIHQPLAGVIIQGAFLSAYRVFTIIPLLPFDKYNNLKKIAHVTSPILMIHGTADEIVPYWHARKLYDVIKAEKNFLWIRGGTHNNLIYVEPVRYWNVVQQFLNGLPRA